MTHTVRRNKFVDGSGVHVIGETKVYNTLLADPTTLRRGAALAFGATEYDLRISILGEHAGSAAEPLAPRLDGKPHPRAKYEAALDGGHRVVPLIHEIFGGMAHEAVAFLRELSRLRAHDLGADSVHATWAAQAFVPFWRQRLSIAVQMGTAMEIERAIEKGEDHIRAVAARKPFFF